MQYELSRRLQLCGEVGEAETDRLMLDDRLAEAATVPRISDRDVERGLRHADRLGGDADASRLQIGERYGIAAALFAQ